MLHETVELEDGTLVQFHTPHWEVDSEITHEELVHLKRIAQCAREELERAKPGTAVWEAMRFILSSPIKATETTDDEGPTWESDYWGYTDHSEPDQTYGAADG